MFFACTENEHAFVHVDSSIAEHDHFRHATGPMQFRCCPSITSEQRCVERLRRAESIPPPRPEQQAVKQRDCEANSVRALWTPSRAALCFFLHSELMKAPRHLRAIHAFLEWLRGTRGWAGSEVGCTFCRGRSRGPLPLPRGHL
ncbi:hypothetical protein MTO96_005445 [Rhipicephalus appendiculatus]